MTTIQDQLTANQAALDNLITATTANNAAASNAIKINGITVGDTDSIADGAIFVYKSDSEKLEPITAIGDLTGATEGQILRWDAVAGRFELANLADVSLAIGELTDVDTTGITEGQVLKWNAITQKFEPGALTAASAGQYAVVGSIQVVDGAEITLSAGITTIQNDVPLLPQLTGVNPRVTSSGAYSSSLSAWKALDGDLGTYGAWVTNFAPTVSTPAWWRFQFLSPVTLGRVILSPRTGSDVQMPRDFKIRTSADSVSFTDRLTVSGASYPSPQNFALSAATASVQSLEIQITATTSDPSGNGGVSGIGEIQAYSQIASSSSLGAISGGFTRARKAILAGIAIQGGNAFVSCGLFESSDKILRIDIASQSINGDFSLGATEIYSVTTQTSSVGGSFNFSIQKDQKAAPIVTSPANKIYIAINNEIKVYSAINGNLITTINCGVATEIQGLGISIEQQKVYGASKAGAIVVIDTGTDTLVATLTAANDTAYGGENFAVAVDDTRDAVYVTSRSTNKVNVLNSVTNTLVTTINVGSTPEGIALSPTLGKAIVCNRNANTVSVINTTNNTVGASIAMSAVGSGAQPTAVAIDEANGKAVVCLNAYHQVAVINLTTNEIEGRAATSPNPVQAQFVPSTGEIYVASEGGNITVISKV
jgi:YVTN family beta-propeller protein